ncbi:MAG: hypothetical protein AAGG68_17295 [Bacteroidota bacterium]
MNSQNDSAFFLLGTTVVSTKYVSKFEKSLDYLVGKGRWNFDLEDCDKVLRLTCSQEEKEDVISYLKLNGVFKLEFQYLKTEIETKNRKLNTSLSSYHNLVA